MERKMVAPQAQTLAAAVPRSTTTLNSRKPPPFNASGSLGIVEVAKSSPSPASAAPPTSAPAIPTLALTPTAVGSGLKAGAVVQVVKRKPKEKGRMRAMAVRAPAGKGKGKQVEESDEEMSSEFDSSDSAMDSESEEEGEGGEESEEEWSGIQEEEGEGVPTAGAEQEEQEEQEDSDSDSEAEDPAAPRRPPREKGAFQAWAEAQVLSASGLTSTLPSAEPISTTEPSSTGYTPLLPSGSGAPAAALPEGLTGPLGSSIPASQLPTLPPQRSTHIPIARTEEMQKQREELPIVKEEDRIMEAIRGNSVVVICGETGSGKTTQVGQFLWEAGWGDKSSGECWLLSR